VAGDSPPSPAPPTWSRCVRRACQQRATSWRRSHRPLPRQPVTGRHTHRHPHRTCLMRTLASSESGCGVALAFVCGAQPRRGSGGVYGRSAHGSAMGTTQDTRHSISTQRGRWTALSHRKHQPRAPDGDLVRDLAATHRCLETPPAAVRSQHPPQLCKPPFADRLAQRAQLRHPPRCLRRRRRRRRTAAGSSSAHSHRSWEAARGITGVSCSAWPAASSTRAPGIPVARRRQRLRLWFRLRLASTHASQQVPYSRDAVVRRGAAASSVPMVGGAYTAPEGEVWRASSRS
jgi:hypothetical protein